jgi:DNA-binding transcriptional ArsR family regulator
MLILMRLRTGLLTPTNSATSLRLNYKTIQYHLETLLENKLVDREEYGYGAKYRALPTYARKPRHLGLHNRRNIWTGG